MTMLVVGLCVSLLLLVLSLEPVGFEKRYATPNLYIPVEPIAVTI